jgi:hypothetical protein
MIVEGRKPQHDNVGLVGGVDLDDIIVKKSSSVDDGKEI